MQLENDSRKHRFVPDIAWLKNEEHSIPLESRILYDSIRRAGPIFDPEHHRPEVIIPECPVFRPTEDEFKRGPIDYISKITDAGEKFGIVKIIPPKNFQNRHTLQIPGSMRFTCRIQRINEHEAFTRCQLRFREAVIAFWRLRSIQTAQPPVNISLYKLRNTVRSYGGYETCTDHWPEVATKMNINPGKMDQLKQYYRLYLHPFENFLENLEKPPPSPPTSDDPPIVTDQMPGKRLRKRRKLSPSDDKDDYITTDYRTRNKCPICQQQARPSSRSVSCAHCNRWFHKRCILPPELVPKMSTLVPWYCDLCLPDEFRKLRLRYDDTFAFRQTSEPVTLDEFRRFSDEYQRMYFKGSIMEEHLVEQEFWRIMQDLDSSIHVQYGADITSKQNNSWRRHNSDDSNPWILANLPKSQGSIFEHYHDDIDGLTIPWLYAGMMFSIFCWHNEDHYLNSINYLHEGQAKTWYGIPGPKAEQFERVIKTKVSPELFQHQPNLLHQLVTHCDPMLLQSFGVPVYRTDQHAGEFVVTFPQAYHAGFNQGFNIAEAVNFAGPRWIEYGRRAIVDYQFLRRPVFSHDQLIFQIARYYQLFSREMLLAIRDDLSRALKREETGTGDHPVFPRHEISDTRTKNSNYEDDNSRQCHQCMHQLYYSAVECHCNATAKYYCLAHIPNRCLLNGRATDESHSILTLNNLKLVPLLVREIDAEILRR